MYRKFTADHIFTGYEILSAPTVLITDGSGVVIDLVNIEEAGYGIEEFQGIISPGFEVHGFLSALIFSLELSLVNSVLDGMAGD